MENLTLLLLKETFGICSFPKDVHIPDWAFLGGFFSITRTADELSIVCPEKNIPEETQSEKNWRAFKIDGVLDFSLVGILAQISQVLANAGISIFAISTYNTDYILLKNEKLEEAIDVLRNSYKVLA
jgi:uncharacterized protein